MFIMPQMKMDPAEYQAMMKDKVEQDSSEGGQQALPAKEAAPAAASGRAVQQRTKAARRRAP